MTKHIRQTYLGLDFSRAYMEGHLFLECNFRDCDFTGTNLSKTTFINCTIINCSHTDADMTDTLYDSCTFQDSSFRTILSHVIFTPSSTYLPSLESLQQAKWTRVYQCISKLIAGLDSVHINYILEQIEHGNVTGKTYQTEFAECITKMIADFKGCEIKELHTPSITVVERFMLSVNPGDTSKTNPLLTILSNYLTMLLDEDEKKIDIKRSAAKEKIGGRALVLSSQ